MSKSSENIGLVNPIINLSSGPVDIKSPDSEKDTISPRSWNKTADILCNMVCDSEKDTISPRSWNKTADILCNMACDSEKDTISPRSWNKTADILCNMACDLDFNDKSKKPKAIKKSSLIPKVKTKPNPKLSDYAKTRRRKGGRFVKEDDN
jgi:hypothetical protein